MRKQTGFTLVELMVVIAIGAVLLSVAIPNFFGTRPEKMLRSAAADVDSILKKARMRAVRENGCFSVTFDAVNEDYQLFLDDGGGFAMMACNGSQDFGETTEETGTLPQGIDLNTIRMTGPNTTVNQLTTTFNGRGLLVWPQNTSVEMTLINSRNAQMFVDLSLSGGSRIR